jgi:hypothetical protein
MLRTMKCALPLVLLLLAYADALRVSSIRLRGTSSDNIDGDDENSLYPYTQVQIPNEIMSQFANGIEMMATRCAISTASYYMSEFHDRESKDFMLVRPSIFVAHVVPYWTHRLRRSFKGTRNLDLRITTGGSILRLWLPWKLRIWRLSYHYGSVRRYMYVYTQRNSI